MIQLTRPLTDSYESIAVWRKWAVQHRDILNQCCVLPEESQAAPLLAARARKAILIAAYDDDYHCPAMDDAENARAIEQGLERVLFWGEPHAIAELREKIRHSSGSISTAASTSLGTATLFSAGLSSGTSHVHAGICELGRTGSVSTISGTIPTIALLVQAFNGAYGECHAICATPRNREKSQRARSGIPIHRQHVRDLRSTFWGFAPWYVMQAGEIEWLDYRELYSNPMLIHDQLLRGGILPFVRERDFSFCRALIALAAPAARDVWIRGVPIPSADQKWSLGNMNLCESLRPYNPIFIEQSSTGDGVDLKDAISQASGANPSCLVVRGEISRLSSSEQQLLADFGFALSCVAPRLTRDLNASVVFIGTWTKPNESRVIAPPHYLNGIDNPFQLVEALAGVTEPQMEVQRGI